MLVVLAGCGRYGFDLARSQDASTDGGGGGADGDGGPCVWSAWSAPTRLPDPILSGFDDWMGTPTLGGTRLYFHSYRATDSDLYVATRTSPSDPFGMPTVVSELATATSQWTPTLTEDGLVIMFADDELGPFHLKMATRADPSAMFGAPSSVAVVSAPPAQQDKSPWLSADGLRLVFTSNRAGVDGLFESTRPDRATDFTLPVQLGLGVGDALDGTLSADGRELFFASRREGSGFLDVWTAHRPAVDQPFAPPMLVSELSSDRDDTGLRLSLDGTTLYLNYDTLTAGGGQADLYTATRTCL
jgi:hypothetical protein